MSEKDNKNRNVWVKCNETLGDGCYMEYAASRNENGYVVMKINSCSPVAAGAVGGGVSCKYDFLSVNI